MRRIVLRVEWDLRVVFGVLGMGPVAILLWRWRGPMRFPSAREVFRGRRCEGGIVDGQVQPLFGEE
ncbi:hypothetical protein ACFL1X_14755 [Candidatus Hydrogenedentota bacterium]